MDAEDLKSIRPAPAAEDAEEFDVTVDAPPPGRARRMVLSTVALVGALASLASLVLLASTAQDARLFDQLQTGLLLVNIASVLVLTAMIGRKLHELVRDWRANVPGSRMKARAVLVFSVLALAPVLLVYSFSLNAINRSIDSWFDVDVRHGLDDAVSLSRAALSLRTRELVGRTTTVANELRGLRDSELVTELEHYRRLSGATQFMVLGEGGRIVASSIDIASGALPDLPAEEAILQARRGQPYVSLDPAGASGYVLLTAASIGLSSGAGSRVLVASYGVPEQLADLGNNVQRAYERYGQRVYQRPLLKTAFTLTLTIVLLLSALGAVYGAFFWATRLVQPVQDLITGTRAVAKGNYDTRIKLPSRDEMGFLVRSFNDMTKRLARARRDADQSRAEVERQRASLAVILARLSTGVISLEPDLRLRTANPAASSILGERIDAYVGRPLDDAGGTSPVLEQFFAACRRHFEAGHVEWREQLQLKTEAGRRELTVACTALPGEAGLRGGLVIVFDDITALLQAQRDAAWGEVARRLAHEIKNPLTPIQLSAERMRRKFLGAMNEKDAQILERATDTIVQQVEAMKQMVNAFSEYARAPTVQLTRFDANQLCSEVVELYRGHDPQIRIRLDCDPTLGMIEADRGRIRQILNNLLTNALEALEGSAGAEITVSTLNELQSDQPTFGLTVGDNGPGFEPAIVDRIFDPYVTSKPKGTGLGLAIVKKIVEEHGGRIEAENPPAGGARVHVALPIDAATRIVPANKDNRRGEQRKERA